ncbi:hypothetical protein Spb1_00200 [Planctopirus ephydatiae]|uniref:Uncharacterized protein n=1 Tax=Planctopirus ephydatiae TaxID=2528019 RepID=A0A518GHV6_9PLAN|nr:hypothetical protein Spb1_00200 [Planctopirus ephydatiae]
MCASFSRLHQHDHLTIEESAGSKVEIKVVGHQSL